MSWLRQYCDAPRDGTVILIPDESEDGVFHWTSVQWESVPDIAEIPEGGFWRYVDNLIADMVPQGPETPFQWIPSPEREKL